MIEYYHLPSLAKTYNLPYHYLFRHYKEGRVRGKTILIGRKKKAIFLLWDENLERVIAAYLIQHRYPTLYQIAQECGLPYRKLYMVAQTNALPTVFLRFPMTNRVFVNVNNKLWDEVVSRIDYEWWRIALVLGRECSLQLPQIDIEKYRVGNKLYISLNQKYSIRLDMIYSLLAALKECHAREPLHCINANVYKSIKNFIRLCLPEVRLQ